MQKGNRLAAMIMAAVLAAGTVTGPVFASDFTTTGEILSEESSNDYLSETDELTDETVPEDSALSIAPASETDSSVSESAAGDQESVSVLSTDAADLPEDGNTTDAQMTEGAEITEDGEEITDPVDSSAVETTDQAAPEETSSEAGEETEAEAVENAEMPDDSDASADGVSSIDETEDVSSGKTDGGEMIADETPAADQGTEESPAPVQEDDALTEEPAATENPAEFLTEDPSAVADPALADVNEGQNTDAEVLEEPGDGETVSEEKAADSEENYNPIRVYNSSLEFQAGAERDICVDNLYYDGYKDEHIKSVKSSNSNVLAITDHGYSFISVSPKKPGDAKVTIEGTYGTVLTIQVKVISFLEKTSVTVKAGYESTVYIYEDDDNLLWDQPYHNHYSYSSSNKNVATASIEEEKENYICKLVINGISPGNAVITVKDKNDGSTSTISVKVINPPFNLSTSKVTIDRLKTWQVTASGSDIVKVSSSNTNILKVEKVNDRKVLLKPMGHGKVTVTFANKFGTRRTVTVAVSYNYFKALLSDRTKTGSMIYGSTVLKGKTAPSATVSVRIGGKTYTAKANSSGIYKIQKIPVAKYGTNLKLTYKLCGTSITKTVKVGKGNSKVSSPYVYKDSTKIPVTVNNAHSGDKIVISIGGKQYTKKFNKAYSRTTVTVPIKKPKKYGIKMTIKLNNKFNQQLASYSAYVYLRSMVRKGDTKAIVKWIPRWNSPSSREVSSNGEIWWYENWDEDLSPEAFLYFNKKGKVDDWIYYN